MKTTYHYNGTPYGLQDMIFDRLEVSEEALTMHLPEGLIKNEEPYQVENGAVTLTGVDFDNSFVHILSRYAMVGEFAGKKIELRRFLEDYRWRDFEINKEYHGENSTIYKGYFSVFNGQDLVVEAMIEISHDGEIVYETEEQEK